MVTDGFGLNISPILCPKEENRAFSFSTLGQVSIFGLRSMTKTRLRDGSLPNDWERRTSA